MKSPLSPHTRMNPETLGNGLKVWRCPDSGGVWIDGPEYRAWLERAGPHTPEPIDTPPTPVLDTERALLSPRTGRFMRKVLVAADIDFRIDFDMSTGGFWLDKGEFEAINALGLQASLNRIPNDSWQRALRTQAEKKQHEQRVLELLGRDDYEKAKQFAHWLQGRERQSEIMAFVYDLIAHDD